MLCIAGGSGLAGMMSILEHAVREGYFRERRAYVYFGVRTLADAFYLQELAAFVAAAGPNLEVTLALSHAPADTATHPQFPAIRLAHGMVDAVAARGMAGRYDNIGGLHRRPAGDGGHRAQAAHPRRQDSPRLRALRQVRVKPC